MSCVYSDDIINLHIAQLNFICQYELKDTLWQNDFSWRGVHDFNEFKQKKIIFIYLLLSRSEMDYMRWNLEKISSSTPASMNVNPCNFPL